MTDAGTGGRCERVWENGDCAGTPACPPRCPRFFADGTPLLARPYDGDGGDLAAMYADLDEHNRTMGVPPSEPDRLREWLDGLLARGWHLVARESDRVVGHVAVVPGDADAPEFLVFVHDDYQGHGVGGELVRQAVAYAAADDHEALRLDVAKDNERAVRLFRALGFDVTERAPADQRMRLDLDHPTADEARRPPAER